MTEQRLGWGDSAGWTNQDFLELSNKIREEVGVTVSHVTLKRIWGKVKYESLPNTYTLSTLVQFIGYENWRDFKVQNGNDTLPAEAPEILASTPAAPPASGRLPGKLKPLLLLLALPMVAGTIMLFTPGSGKKINPADYHFTSRKVLEKGVPNSVIFDYDATRAPADSVIIQQSWDTSLRTHLSKNRRQHTLIYYFPGFFEPKLIVDNQVVQQHGLLIKSDGWLAAVELLPVPVYFDKKDFIANGKMSLPIEKMTARHIGISPQPPLLFYSNVQDFGNIYTDDFVFETTLKNDFREGAAICQMTTIYLLCEGTAIGIPLCARGCESSVNFFFTDFSVSGKLKDLSCFGVDFNHFVKARVESANGKAKIYLDGKLCYEVDHGITRSKIIGIDFAFQGTGTVDQVKLSNGEVLFEDQF